MNDFLPNTDNFFKYLLTIGMLLIVFTILYPIQKQKEVDLEIVTYNTDTAILNFKLKKIEEKVAILISEKDSIQAILDGLKIIRDKSNKIEASNIEKNRISLKEYFDKNKSDLNQLLDSLSINAIKLNEQKKRIKKLESYFAFFRNYKLILLVLGFILSFIGLRYWIASVYMEEIKKSKEINDTYQSSFIRHIDFCKNYFTNKWTVVSLLGILFLIIIWVCMNF